MCVYSAVVKFYDDRGEVFMCCRVMFYCSVRVLCEDRLVQKEDIVKEQKV
jgi:hypothetical protein